MMTHAENMDLDVDLQGGVVPISKVASSLAALLKRGRERRQPIIVTQKGYPTGVLLPIDMYVALRELAERGEGGSSARQAGDADALPERTDLEQLVVSAQVDEQAASSSPEDARPRRSRGGQRSKKSEDSEG